MFRAQKSFAPPLNAFGNRTTFPRARSSITRLIRLFALAAVTGSILLFPSGTWAASPSPPRSPDDRAYAVEKALLEFKKALFVLQEADVEASPHIEILVELDRSGDRARAQDPAHHVETVVEIDSGGDRSARALASPDWIRIAFDDVPAVEHPYSDTERRALNDGGLQSVLTAPIKAGRHTLAVTLKGAGQGGKRYSKTKGFTFETGRPVVHAVLRVVPSSGEEPQLELDVVERAWMEPLPPGTTDDPVYRLGVFACGAGDFDTAASLFLASLDRPAPIRPDQTRLRLAEAIAEMGLSEEAEAMLVAMIPHIQDDVMQARAWLLIERVAFRGGRHARALEAYDRVDFARAATLPSSLLDDAHLFAGTSALLLRQYPRASAAFRRVARNGPDVSLALYGHAQALVGTGDAFTANTVFKQLIEAPSSSDPVQARVADFARMALGFESLEQGRYEEALSELQRVRPAHPTYEAALFGIGWAFRKMGEHVKAIAIFQDLLARFPHGQYAHEARLTMAASYADLRAYTRAVTAYRSALEAGMTSLRELDQRRDAVNGQTWDPVAERVTADTSYPTQDATAFSQSVERYRWFLRGGEELRRALGRLSASVPSTQEKHRGPVPGAPLVSDGRSLLVRVDAMTEELRGALRGQARKALDREQQQLEEWSVRASIGIAKTLIADRDELGSGALTFD